MKAPEMAVEVFCDCNHRRSVHWAVAVSDFRGDRILWRGQCGLVGCTCEHYTQDGQRAMIDANGTDVGGVSASW